MVGNLKKNENNRWEIVNKQGERVELTSGDTVELLNGVEWVSTRIEHGPDGYYAVDGSTLYTGKIARSTDRIRF